MMLSSMHRMVVKAVATVGGGAVGFYSIGGSRKERMLQSLVGMGAGYAASSLALSMIPDTTAPAVTAGAP